jgi:molecular chaperone DnaK (HSP70)
VGRRAQELALARPPSVVFQSKRFMGREYAALPAADAGRFPFRIINASGRFAFELPLRAGPAVRTPEEVAAAILSHLKTVAKTRLAQPVHRAVLAVPADFTAAQRNATQRAGMLAGLDVVRIINEPTAAAMAYGLHKRVRWRCRGSG